MLEAGATAVQELAFTIADGLEYVRHAIDRGLDVDAFAGRLSFFFGIGMNFFMEVAKLRASRLLWSRVMREFEPKKPASLMLRTHCQTSGVSLTEQDPYNNIVRTTVEAMAAVLGGTQSLHTNSFDEALALPTDFAARIARNTQLILAEETGITHVVDPLGGSYYVEALTDSLAKHAWALIEEVEALGGMTKAVESGMPKLRIEEAAARRQARGRPRRGGHRRRQQVPPRRGVGGRHPRGRQHRGPAEPDRTARARARRRATRPKTRAALERLTEGARGDGNLLELSHRGEPGAGQRRRDLRRPRAGVHPPPGRRAHDLRCVRRGLRGRRGVTEHVRDQVEEFAKAEGRRPRLLVVKMGQDGHDRGAKVIATAFADLGFDVDVGPLFQTPEEAARDAVENDVHVIGVSSQAAGHKTLVPDLVAQLRKQGGDDILVVVGGVIPANDYEFLRDAGVAAVFGPGTNIPDAASKVLTALSRA